MTTENELDPASGEPQNHEPARGITRREVFQGINVGLLAFGAAAAMPMQSRAADAAGTAGKHQLGPHKVREIENAWIPMADGTKIAARLWLPEDAEAKPAPALLEYIPYRKRDDTRLGDESFFSFYASHGYAGIRADIRGAGDSEGLPQDEYVKQEQDDGLEIIAWIAAQPWCSGKVGMFGISWGGFAALQVAARRPPALKAIITHCSTDDRYTDDAHYTGGTINECMFFWGSLWTMRSVRPPDPQIVGARWRDMWRSRLEGLDFFLADWLSHQHRDEFWKHASVNEDYGAIQCPVYAVGGWADPYAPAIPRMLANLKVPRKGLIGPWAHRYPHQAYPGPEIDWLNESLRWWDHWLKDIDTGIMREPMLRAWMQNETLFQGDTEVSGRWVAEERWPSARIRMRRLHLNDLALDNAARPEVALKLAPLQTVGITAPYWYTVNEQELPGDQRIDDARSLSFDSAVLSEPLEILGAAVAHFELAVDKPVAFLAVRLNEVMPDGVSRRVTYQVLNLCHRDGHESPQPLEPGKRYRVRVQLCDIAHVFKPGCRIRVALSTTYWPMIWPSPEPVSLTLYTGSSSIELPVRPLRPEDGQLRPFGPAFIPENSGSTPLVAGRGRRGRLKSYTWPYGSGPFTIHTSIPYSRYRLDATGTEIFETGDETVEILDGDPTSASFETRRMFGYYRPGWDVRVEILIRFVSTRDMFTLVGEVKAFDDNKPFFARKWERPITRNLV